MKKVIIPLFSIFVLTADSQNLVPNGSFENYSSCPPTSVACVGRIDLTNSWFIPVDGNSPDFYNACHIPPFPGLNVDVPNNMYGTQAARTGVAYTGFYPRTEYIEVQLTSTLVAGENYNFEMYVNMADVAQETTDGIGVYFSNTVTTAAAGWGNAQINNATFNFITNTTVWTLISDTYTATGGENYITLGNFFSAFYPVFNASGSLANSYYYIDDVSLVLSTPLPIELSSFDAKAQNNTVVLNWVTASEINNDFFTIEKSDNGIDFEEIGIIEGAGNSTQLLSYSYIDDNINQEISYYRLRQTDFDGSTTVSEIKSVNFKNHSTLTNSIYPNPSSGVYEISLSKEANITVHDITGRLITQIVNNNSLHQTIDISDKNDGVYLITISNGNYLEIKKLIKQ